MFSTERIAGFWLPLIFGTVFFLIGWALPLVAHDPPSWVSKAAFIVAGLLVFVAVLMGRRIGKRVSPDAEGVTIRGSFNQNVTSRNQEGGVTAHSINIGNDHGRPSQT